MADKETACDGLVRSRRGLCNAGIVRRTLGFLALTLLVCLSRIYAGTHYLTDVLGGTFTGLLAALLVPVAYRENSMLDRVKGAAAPSSQNSGIRED
jgi:membrane-associated phospholipid phosphatase